MTYVQCKVMINATNCEKLDQLMTPPGFSNRTSVICFLHHTRDANLQELIILMNPNFKYHSQVKTNFTTHKNSCILADFEHLTLSMPGFQKLAQAGGAESAPPS